MQVLVDTSIWIDYFRSGIKSSELSVLIDENLIVTNYIILAELIASLTEVRQVKIVSLVVLSCCDFCPSFFGTTSLSFNR